MLQCLFWVAGVEGETRLFLQPPAGVLPAPVCFLGGAAVCEGDPLRVNLYYYDDVSIAFVIVPDQIAGADLLPAGPIHPPPGQISKRGVRTQGGPACAVHAAVVGPVAGGAVG